MPSAPPTVSRRHVLFGAAALALLGATATACGSATPPPEIDELAAQLARAQADSQLARDAVATADPKLKAALTAAAEQRSAHAQALSDEIARIGDERAPTSTSPTSTTAEPVTPPTAADVVGALQQSAESAAQLAGQLSGYRAGLLGSIAAACTAAYRVALAGVGATP